MQIEKTNDKDYCQMWVRAKQKQCQKETVKKMTETYNYTHTKMDGVNMTKRWAKHKNVKIVLTKTTCPVSQ